MPALTTIAPPQMSPALSAAAGARLVGLLCIVAVIYLLAAQHDASRLASANRQDAAGHYAAALDSARHVSRTPAKDRAMLVEAYALESLGRTGAADRAYAEAAKADPNNWVLHRDWALLLAHAGQTGRARQEMNRALELNPLMEMPPEFLLTGSAARPGHGDRNFAVLLTDQSRGGAVGIVNRTAVCRDHGLAEVALQHLQAPAAEWLSYLSSSDRRRFVDGGTHG